MPQKVCEQELLRFSTEASEIFFDTWTLWLFRADGLSKFVDTSGLRMINIIEVRNTGADDLSIWT
ncbi:hypothetical protein P3T76_005549 [Phytophthora citrophthora]|uniref:Uncharacterized protein n=1 Tax=Phytophthora citrophthora TaxID=4793 RepID=A0AAD9GQK3_9STRA|nr:hypothetical protein P3T76_005549 [Phytophthora citrophthora]